MHLRKRIETLPSKKLKREAPIDLIAVHNARYALTILSRLAVTWQVALRVSMTSAEC